ncbi:maleylpyruvate isomerase family mycothiol-dependent enzyme [Agrococcus baldri]|uniref:TIGR03083 family protein n=1 Tax=Agrococcus baldri TaxID=153730 RepID=A0AA87RC76_9MICO|nr:maleylpyruvate isomerase family mycothiol-dependent enzyme [Agrococcus baldri]GEK79987.1 hypothetical protein ABA31_13380 [Agrococcus baldri]
MDHLRTLAELQERFLETTRRGDPATPILWLGRWRVEQLVVHLARIHHWAAGQARREQETPLGRGPFDDLPALYEVCAAELRATLAELDPDARAWALVDDGVPRAQQRGTVRFWYRRQLHETLVHLWDLRTAIGEGVDDLGIGDEVWLDCLDEVVGVMHPRQLRLERVAPPAARIVFAPTGADASWTLAGAPDDAPVVTVAGPASALALLAWGRGVPDDDRLAGAGVEVKGERSLADAVLRAGITP